MSGNVLPWGETLEELAEAVWNDRDAPLVLFLAAAQFRLLGDDRPLRSLLDEASALNEADAS